jgi:hypothetical protein
MLEEDSDTRFLQSVTNQIEGWLFEPAANITQRLLRKQELNGDNKPLLEIGVYAGKYLSLFMASAARANAKVVGIDTFEYKPFEAVKETIAKLMPQLASTLTLYPESSRSFSTDKLIAVLGRKARFISIDGSDEYINILHDLVLCNDSLDDGGIIAVDGFLNPRAMARNRAVNAFMEQISSRARRPDLEGFAYVTNKLFLARHEAATAYREFVDNLLTQDKESYYGRFFNEQMAIGRALVEQPFFGASVIVLALRANSTGSMPDLARVRT